MLLHTVELARRISVVFIVPGAHLVNVPVSMAPQPALVRGAPTAESVGAERFDCLGALVQPPLDPGLSSRKRSPRIGDPPQPRLLHLPATQARH